MKYKFNCPRCGYFTNHCATYKRHLSRKIICDNILSDDNLQDEFVKFNIIDKIEMVLKSAKSKSKVSLKSAKSKYFFDSDEDNLKYECKYCENKYVHKQSLFKHLKTCKEKKKDETVKESMTELARLLNEKDKQMHEKDLEHKRQIEELIKKAGIVNSNNVTNNIQNNIKLLNYKDTDITDLTENDYVKCLEHYNFCVPHLIKRIHFNPKKPENHNVYISNLKNSYIMIYMNNKWKVKNRDETILRMIDDKQILFEKKIQECVKSGNQYPKLMAKFSRYIEKREQNDVINAIKEDIKLMLYNNRNMIIENNKKLLKN